MQVLVDFLGSFLGFHRTLSGLFGIKLGQMRMVRLSHDASYSEVTSCTPRSPNSSFSGFLRNFLRFYTSLLELLGFYAASSIVKISIQIIFYSTVRTRSNQNQSFGLRKLLKIMEEEEKILGFIKFAY